MGTSGATRLDDRDYTIIDTSILLEKYKSA